MLLWRSWCAKSLFISFLKSFLSKGGKESDNAHQRKTNQSLKKNPSLFLKPELTRGQGGVESHRPAPSLGKECGQNQLSTSQAGTWVCRSQWTLLMMLSTKAHLLGLVFSFLFMLFSQWKDQSIEATFSPLNQAGVLWSECAFFFCFFPPLSGRIFIIRGWLCKFP